MYKLDGKLFDWDKRKNLANLEKHGISFKVAATAFLDPEAVTIEDWRHSQDENRFILIGYSKNYELLSVCHCLRFKDEIVRIISARTASESEQLIYKEGS